MYIIISVQIYVEVKDFPELLVLAQSLKDGLRAPSTLPRLTALVQQLVHRTDIASELLERVRQ